MADKTIKIRGEFDANGILASFKKIRDEAAKSNVSDKLLSGYDKELEKVEKLTTQILAAQSRGLTDNQSIKEFARLVNQLEKQYGILNVKAQAFTDAASYKTETAEIRQYSNQLKTLIDRQKSLEKSARDYIDANSDALKLSKEESKALKQSISDAQAYKDVLDEIVQKRIDAAKQKIADRSLSTTGGSQKYAEITGQTANFTLSAADKKGRDTSRKSLVGRNGQFDETKAITVANQEYNRILEDAIVNNRTAEDALQEMIKTMRAYKLELGDTEEVQKKFAQDLASIKDAAWENHGNLTGNDKGAFTRVEHKIDAIKSNASGLYNNVSVVQNTQVGQTIDQVNREKIKSETEYNRQVEQTISLQQRLRQQANDTAESIISGEKAEIAESQKNLEIKNAIEDSFNKIGQGAKQILSVTTAWRSLRNVVRNTFNDVKALDKSFASIAMVTEYSVKDMWQQYGQYAEMANRLGQSTQSVVEASGLYYQQGLKTNEVLKLTEETMKLATLAGLDFKEATSQMTAALRAFHMDMSEGAHVTDVYAEVAAHAAVDVQGLSEAMSATAAIANSAGMSFENTTAMLATMVEATQEAPKNLGTAMKTIIARFTELKENVAGTADSEFDDLDYNKVDKALKSVGVSLKDATGQFRNMDEVFLELSSKWNTLDRNSQRYIATIAAGSRQQSRFIALMENYERTMELVDVAQNSAGRSSQQFAKYQDTVEYRLNKIKNSWEQFRTNLLDSDAYKGALDLFGGFLEKLNNTSATGLATLAGTWLTFGRKAIGGTINGWSGLGSGLVNKIAGGGQDKEAFKTQWRHDNQSLYAQNGILDEQAMEAMDQASEKAWKKQEQKVTVKSKAIGNIISTGIATAITTGLTIDDPVTAGLTATATSALSLAPTFIQLGTQLGGPMGAAIGAGVSVGIGAISGLISWFRSAQQAAKEATAEFQAEKLKKEIESLNQTIEDQRAKVKGDASEINNLEKIKKEYDELGNKMYLTSAEQERYNELVQTITEEHSDLISYYDKETGKLQLQTDLLDQQIQKTTKLKEIASQKLQQDETSKIIKTISLDAAEQEIDFKKRIQETSYKKDKLLPGQGSYSSGPTEKGLYDIAKENNFDSDKVREALQQDVNNGLITQQELSEILTVVKSFQGQATDYYNDFKAVDRERIENSNLYKGETEEFKNAVATVTATLKENASLGNDAISKTVENLSTEQDDILGNLEYLEKSIGKNNEFMRGFDTEAMRDAILDVRSGWNTQDDWEDLADSTKKQLEKLGITAEEEYKKLVENGALSEEKFTKKVYELIAAKAIAGIELSSKGQERLKELQSKIDDLNKGNYSTEEYNQKRTSLLEEYKGTFSGGAERLIKESANLTDGYNNLLKEIGLDNDAYFKNLDSKLASSMEKTLSTFKEKVGILGNDAVQLVAKSYIDAVEKSGLTGQAAEALLTFDPKTIENMDYDQALSTIVELISDDKKTGAVSKETGEKIGKNILEGLEQSGITNFNLNNAMGFEKALSKLGTQLKNSAQSYKNILDTTLSQYKSQGYIDIFNLDKIKEEIDKLGLKSEDYLYTNENGNFLLNYEKLSEAMQKQLKSQEELVKKLEQQKKEAIAQLETEKLQLLAILNNNTAELERLRIERQITKEKYNQLSLRPDIKVDEFLKGIDISDLDVSNFELTSEQKEAIIKQVANIDDQIDALTKTDVKKQANELYQASVNQIAASNKAYKEGLKELEKEKDKAYKDWQDKTKAVADAQKSLAKAIETVTEKQKELKATIEGTNWKSSIDGMYNYNTALDFLTKQTERAKKDLEKASTIDAAKRNFAVYGQGLLDQKAQLQAQNQVYRTAYNNIGRVYNNDVAKLIKSFEDSGQMKFNLADYLVFDEKTGTKINMNALQKAKMPEALKKWIETQGQKANEYLTKIWDNDDKVKQLNEEFIEHQRQALDGYVELQDKMIEVLREKYQKQIDDLRTKYEAMNEADDQYVDALQKNIDKQRKLRDQERSWNDLENKERKLALLRRDTSRGNAVEVRSLEKEVQDDRTSLLDSAVDDIIEKLREFYELQKEQRELEITYQEALIDDVALMKEATEALQKIQTSDELVNWWKKNVTEMEKMSDEKLQTEKQDWAELFKKKTDYVTSVDDTVLASIQNSEKNLKDVADKTEEIVRTTSEGITELASKSLEEAGEEYKKAVKTAKDALQDAVDAVAKQKEALQAAIDAANESKKAFDDIAAKYKEALGKPQQTVTQIYKGPDGSPYTSMEELNRHMNSVKTAGTSSNTTKPVYKTPDGRTYSSYAETSISQKPNQNTKTVIIGQSGDTVKLFTSTSELSSMNSSISASTQGKGTTYTNKGRVTMPEVVKHGVLTYNEKDEKWELLKPFDKLEDAEKYIKDQIPTKINDATSAKKYDYWKNKTLAFAEGGLVNFTGPAWVDGSRSRPEAFLSAEDTRRIGEAARILADLPILSQPVNQEQLPTTTIGDTTIQIDVHVDSIASDYDLDEAMNKVEKRIVEAAKYTGSNVILKKR